MRKASRTSWVTKARSCGPLPQLKEALQIEARDRVRRGKRLVNRSMGGSAARALMPTRCLAARGAHAEASRNSAGASPTALRISSTRPAMRAAGPALRREQARHSRHGQCGTGPRPV
jgi:hypothetical protein